jgi:hypothetical protein
MHGEGIARWREGQAASEKKMREDSELNIRRSISKGDVVLLEQAQGREFLPAEGTYLLRCARSRSMHGERASKHFTCSETSARSLVSLKICNALQMDIAGLIVLVLLVPPL